uniref:Glycosyltransferase family 92 protein n=1 Tax=Meloidogyne hapla TaxID=6305 RepID=A0A1I8BU84_MELHA
MDLYVLTCKNININQNKYFVVLNEPNWLGWRKHTNIEINPQKTDQKPRSLVLCISRVFAFERWQLLITALEMYRLLNVNLVVAHIQSAITSVYNLLKLYESEGILSIRPGIRFPHSKDMQWDPNAETEFNGQILLAHECFYEFRENTEFIGLIDWDDLLLPSKNFVDLPSVFKEALIKYPNTAYFLVNKLEAKFEEKSKYPRLFNLRNLMEKGIMMAHIYNDEKMVVRPKTLRGFWMHHSHFLEKGFKSQQLLTNYSILLHLANEDRVKDDEFIYPILKRFNISEMKRHSNFILSKMAKKNVRRDKDCSLNGLPKKYIYFNAISECHRLIFAYYKSINPTKSHCLSYSLCELPKVKQSCTVVKSFFDKKRTKNTGNVVHIRIGSEFEEREGCADENRRI